MTDKVAQEKALQTLHEENERLGLYRDAYGQPEQEPVAWMFQHDETGRMNYVSNDGIHNPAMFLEMNPRYALVYPLYTHPPQRTWVSLSDEDRNDCLVEADPCECLAEPEAQELMRCVEAKLRSKNQ